MAGVDGDFHVVAGVAATVAGAAAISDGEVGPAFCHCCDYSELEAGVAVSVAGAAVIVA